MKTTIIIAALLAATPAWAWDECWHVAPAEQYDCYWAKQNREQAEREAQKAEEQRRLTESSEKYSKDMELSNLKQDVEELKARVRALEKSR